MTINLIAAVVQYKNKLAIGANGDLLVKIKEDMKFFKNITMAMPNAIVLMGRKTYYSIPQEYRPLINRYNFVLTNDRDLIKKYHLPKNPILEILDKNVPYFMNFKTFQKFYKKCNPNVFVIGGEQIYNKFLSTELKKYLIPSKLYITQVSGFKFDEEKHKNITFMNNFNSKYKLIGYSEKFIQKESNVDNVLSARILHYKYYENYVSEEYKYLNLAKNILENGKERIDRTGTGTFSLFGSQLRFDISNENLPLLTTKQVPLKAIIEELLFFCRGDTDATILNNNKGVKIWNDNTSREFLDNRELKHYPEGVMGPMYGWSWRHFGAKYSSTFSDSNKCNTNLIGGFDQLAHVEHLLKTDPFSRRIYISNLNPAESSKMCLDMCHTYIQFYVEEINGIKYLSGYFTMRSSDYFLAAISFNLVSYNLLLNILALRCNMKPKEIVYNAVDCHIYKNHIEQINEQLTRTPRSFPKIKLDKSLKNKDWSEMKYSDFELIGYFPHSSIKAPMAI
jgi:thymidylate synthase